MCSAAITNIVVQKGERWSPWQQALFEMLMQRGVRVLVHANLAEPEVTVDGERTVDSPLCSSSAS